MILNNLIAELGKKLTDFEPGISNLITVTDEIKNLSTSGGTDVNSAGINIFLDSLKDAPTKSALYPAILTKLLQTANTAQAAAMVAWLSAGTTNALIAHAKNALKDTLKSDTRNLAVLVTLLAGNLTLLQDEIKQVLDTAFTADDETKLTRLFTELAAAKNSALLPYVQAALGTALSSGTNLDQLVPALITQQKSLNDEIINALSITFKDDKAKLTELFAELVKGTKALLPQVQAALVSALSSGKNLDNLVPALITQITDLTTTIEAALATTFKSADQDKLTQLFSELAKPVNNALHSKLEDALAAALISSSTHLDKLVPALLTQYEPLKTPIEKTLTKIFGAVGTPTVLETSLDKLFTEISKPANHRLYPTLQNSLQASFLSVNHDASEIKLLFKSLAKPDHHALRPTLKKAIAVTFKNSLSTYISNFINNLIESKGVLGDTLQQAFSETFQETDVNHIAPLFNALMAKKTELEEVVQTTVTQLFQTISAEQVKKLADLLITPSTVLTTHKEAYREILQKALNHAFESASKERVVALAAALSDTKHDGLRNAALSHLFSLKKDKEWFADVVNLCRVRHSIKLKEALSTSFATVDPAQLMVLAQALAGNATLRSDALSLLFQNNLAAVPTVVKTLQAIPGLCQSALSTAFKKFKDTTGTTVKGKIAALIGKLKGNHPSLIIEAAVATFKIDAEPCIANLLAVLKEKEHEDILKKIVVLDLTSATDASRINFWNNNLTDKDDKTLLQAALLQIIETTPDPVKISSWMATLDQPESEMVAETVLKNSKKISSMRSIIDALQAANHSPKNVLFNVIQDPKTTELRIRLLVNVVEKHPHAPALLQGLLSKLLKTPADPKLTLLLRSLEKEGHQALCQEILGHGFIAASTADRTALLHTYPQRYQKAFEKIFTAAELSTIQQLVTALDSHPYPRQKALINALQTANPAAITRLFTALDSDQGLRQTVLTAALETADAATLTRLFTALETTPASLQAAAGDLLYQLSLLDERADFQRLIAPLTQPPISPVFIPLGAAVRDLLGYLSRQNDAEPLQQFMAQLPDSPAVNQLVVDVAITLAKDPKNDPQIIALLETLTNPVLLAEVTANMLHHLANQADGEKRLTQLMAQAQVQGSTRLGGMLQKSSKDLIYPLNHVLQYQLAEPAKKGEPAAARLIAALASSPDGTAQLGSLLNSTLCEAPVYDFVRSQLTPPPPAA